MKLNEVANEIRKRQDYPWTREEVFATKEEILKDLRKACPRDEALRNEKRKQWAEKRKLNEKNTNEEKAPYVPHYSAETRETIIKSFQINHHRQSIYDYLEGELSKIMENEEFANKILVAVEDVLEYKKFYFNEFYWFIRKVLEKVKSKEISSKDLELSEDDLEKKFKEIFKEDLNKI